MSDAGQLLHCCLYFTANALARSITRLADEEFRATGISPSHAFLLMLVVDKPGITQKELAESLQLAPSTITRFIDALAHKGHLERSSEGNSVRVLPTAAGKRKMNAIRKSWKALHDRYAALLGRETGDDLTRRIDEAASALDG